jgi:hypothetical protein
MKKILTIFLISFLTGCSSVKTEGKRVGVLDLKKKSPSVAIGVSTIQKQESKQAQNAVTNKSNTIVAKPISRPQEPKKGAEVLMELASRSQIQKKEENKTAQPIVPSTPQSQKSATNANISKNEEKSPINLIKIDSENQNKEIVKVGVFDVNLTKLLLFYLIAFLGVAAAYFLTVFVSSWLRINKLKNPFKKSPSSDAENPLGGSSGDVAV